MRPSHSESAGLAVILVLAALVRLWGLDFGLPQTWSRPDENFVVRPVLEYFGGDLHPHSFVYGSLPSYLVFAVAAVAHAVERLGEGVASVHDLRLEYLIDPSELHGIARGLSAAFGVATVWLTFRSARRWYGRDVALAAAAFLALGHLHVRDSHFGVADVMQTCFIVLAFERTQAWWETGRIHAALGAGAAAGFAAATKYAGALVLVPFAIAALLRATGRERSARSASLALCACAGAALVAFLASTPFALADFHAFRRDLATNFQNLQFAEGPFRGNGWTRHLGFSLWHGLGPPVLVAAILGAALRAWGDRRRTLVLLAFPLAYLAVTGPGAAVFVRYAIPWTPFLAICAATCVVAAADRLEASARVAARAPRAAAARLAALAPRGSAALLATLACAAPSIRDVVRTNAALARTDSRELAAQWIEQHVPRGTAVAQVGGYGRVQLPASAEARRSALALLAAWDPGPEARLARARLEPLRTREGEGYPACRWRARDSTFLCEGVGAVEPPPYVLVSRSPRTPLDEVPPELARLLAEQYEPAWSVETGAAGASADDYDVSDAFYLPFATRAGVLRVGPDIVIHARRASR